MSETTMTRQLHPDFKSFDPKGSSWDWDAPVGDIYYALEYPRHSGDGEMFTFDQIKSVDRYHVEYHGSKWCPGETGGSELAMFLLGELEDGRWFSIEAGNDYTGWGCRDYSNVYTGPTREDVIHNGITDEGRRYLGVSL